MARSKRYCKINKKLPRRNRISFNLNDSEVSALNNYCRRYKITNRSHLIRQTLMSTVLDKLNNDYPTLFDLSKL